MRTDPYGRRRYLDVEWDEYKLVIEIDGAHHADVEQWSADLDRQNEEVIGDRRVLRYSSITVRTQEERVLSQVTRAMRRAA
jgi:very-short-patch-repair endonuclease